jgi:uncharacterized protein (DUF488 family)
MANDLIFTVGHGTLEADAFVGLLREGGVRRVVDVRRFPGSRRHPQFNREALARTLEQHGIDYRWEEELGGRRSAVPDSPHRALRQKAFQGYADHMDTEPFQDAMRELLAEANETPTAVLCAESVWWRCHRRMIADHATLVGGTEVHHMMHDGRVVPHEVTDAARAAQDRVIYDSQS